MLVESSILRIDDLELLYIYCQKLQCPRVNEIITKMQLPVAKFRSLSDELPIIGQN